MPHKENMAMDEKTKAELKAQFVGDLSVFFADDRYPTKSERWLISQAADHLVAGFEQYITIAKR